MRKIVIDQKDRVYAWVKDRMDLQQRPEMCCTIGLEEDGELVAAVIFNQWYHPSISGHIASDGTKRWANKAFLRAMFDYPFRQLGCRRITAPIAAKNEPAIRFVEKLGFVLEGRLRRALPDGDDRLLFGLLKEDCKWT